MTLFTGQRIGGWTLLSKLGSGVDGQVWSVQREVHGGIENRAMKVCEPSPNFFQEYEFLRTVDIPGVVRVYEYNRIENLVYYIMDLAEGLPFTQYLRAFPMEDRYEECVHLLVSITHIIDRLHALGLMHLDIKSDNLIVSQEGTITLIDFGKIGFVDDYSVHRKGSHLTMSPEQRSHWYVTPKSDVYSLAVTVYQAFMDTPVPFANIGRPWPSLLTFCVSMEQSFAGLIQQCLHLVPSERPSMAELHEAICKIQTNEYRTLYFPISENYIGECPVILNRSCILVGHIGSGRRRILLENIRSAYLDGIPTFIATADPLQPFHLWRVALESVLTQFSIQKRLNIIQGVEGELHSLLPNLFVHTESIHTNIEVRALARAINIVLSRCTPLNIVIQQIDAADIGSLQIAEYLWTHPIKNLTLWGTSLHQMQWATNIEPPAWNKESDELLMTSLLGHDSKKKTIPGRNPLQTSIKAWHLIAKRSNEANMTEGISTSSMWTLGLLREPFSTIIATILHPNMDALISLGVLEFTNPQRNALRFRFLPFRWMVQQSLMIKDKYEETHLDLVDAWGILGSKSTSQDLLYHLFQGGNLGPVHLGQALWVAIMEMDLEQISQWWWMSKLHGLLPSNSAFQIASLLIPLLKGIPIQPVDLQHLEERELKPAEICVVQYLRFKYELSVSNHLKGIQLAEQLLNELSPEIPKFQLMVYVDLADMYIQHDDANNAVRLCQHACTLPIMQSFPDISIQLQSLLAHGLKLLSKLPAALQTCKRGLMLEQVPLIFRIQLYHTQGILQYQLGKRTEARSSWTAIQRHRGHPATLTNQRSVELESIRLELETGKAQYLQHRVHRLLSMDRSSTEVGILQAICWDLATQMASSRWAKIGFSIGNEALSDRARLALAKWYWLIGDLQQGFQILQSQENTYDGLYIRVEQIRFAILLGYFDWALKAALSLRNNTLFQQFADLSLLLTLCIECLEPNKPADFLDGSLEHEWIEIYLGGLHLRAMRKRLRSEDNCDTLELLKRRAQASNHQLYLALSDPALYV